MTSQLFGWNINAAESNESAVLDIVRRIKARSHTVMHGVTMARKVYDAVGQATGEEPIIVCREDWPDQNWTDAKYSNMTNYFNQWKSRGGYWPQALVYTFNEPVVSGDTNKLKSLLNKSIDAMNASAATGVKAVIGNYADASLFERHWLDAGLFDEWCRVASQYTNGGHGYIGHHNYSYGLPWTGSAGVPYAQMKTLNPQPPTREAFQTTEVWGNWLQGRFMWPLLRCDFLDVPRYKFVCTEAAWDRMPNGELEGWIGDTERHWGLGKLRGPLDQRALWGKLYPHMTQALSGVWQLEQLANMMAGLPCYGVHLFTLSYNHEWATFNFLQWPEFVNELASYGQRATWTPGKVAPPVTNPTPAVTPGTKGEPARARLRTSSFINVRNAPATTATAYPNPPGNKKLLTYYPATKRRNNNYDWYWVEVDGGPSGWQAQVVEYPEEQWIMPDAQEITFRVPAQYQHVILAGGKFDAPRNYNFNPSKLQKHEGLDFSSLHSSPQPRLVVAPHSGVVQKVVLNDQYYGQYVRVSFGKGFRGYFAHLSKVLVTVGQTVQEGDVIGHEGQTGNASGPHLHWTVVQIGYGLKDYVVDDVVNPEPLLRAAPVVVEPPPADDDTGPTLPLYGVFTSDELAQLADLYTRSAQIDIELANIYRATALRMQGG